MSYVLIAGHGSKYASVYVPPTTYSTTFPATENPIAEAGVWTRGGTEGVKWTDPRTTGGTPGFAFATMTAFDGTHFIDSIAHLSGFAANHRAQCTIRVNGTTTNLECELFTRAAITSGNARGYEVDMVITSGEIIIVRWNGPGGTDGTGAGVAFDVMQTITGITFGDGDVWTADQVGPVLTVKQNGVTVTSLDVQAWAVTNGGNYWSTGQPGMGFWNQTGASSSNFAIKAFSATDL